MTIEIKFDEKDIEDFLSEQRNIRNYLQLRFIARQVKIFDFYIDILAYSKREKCFYIIELKKDNLDTHAYAQVRKYKRLMHIKYRGKHKFKTLLIGQNLSDELIGLVNFYQNDYWGLPYDITDYYVLFGCDFQQGISFNWYNRKEKEFEKTMNAYIGEFINDKSR